MFLTLVLLGLAATRAQAQESASPPQALRGADARRAAELEQQINVSEDDQNALALSEELLALRSRVQGKDHWETINARWRWM